MKNKKAKIIDILFKQKNLHLDNGWKFKNKVMKII